MAEEIIIDANESIKSGKYFSNFYGGALVRSNDIEGIRNTLAEIKREQNLFNEIKWSKVTEQDLPKYIAVMNTFFDFVQNDQIKVRIMFTQNANGPVGLNEYQRENTYYLLYYQFIKHAFGLAYANQGDSPVNLRVYLDKLPDTKEKIAQFKAYLVSLEKSVEFRNAHIKIDPEQIADVSSHDHVVLQCLDVVLGAMQFRLNDKHLAKPADASRRGKRTRAKEALYEHILRRIQLIFPRFNIGISTGTQGDRQNYWLHSYRHWLFVPAEYVRDTSKTKPGKQKTP